MKKYIFLSAALLLFTASCSNDENNNETKEQVQAVQFSFTNEEFGEDETLTRSAETAKPQIVDLDDCEAEITVESEPTAKTRGALSPANGHYTIRAYQAGTFKGEMKGTFSGGTFTPDASSSKKLMLPYGTYDFVAFNDDVTVSGTNLTTTRDKAETARMGFATVTITGPTPIQVQFTMKHVGCRLRTQFICKKHFPENITATLEQTAANVIPTSVAYNLTTKSYITTNGVMVAENNDLPANDASLYFASNHGQNYAYTSTSDYHYFLPSTAASKLKLNFTGGTLFAESLNGISIPKLNATLQMQANKSYVVKIKLNPNYIYLMSDGTIGHFKDTTFGGGTKTPVAIVLSRSNHIAIALKEANGGAVKQWTSNVTYSAYVGGQLANTHAVTNIDDALTSQITSGLDETWDPSYTTSVVTGNKVKALNPDFPAFNAAANYNPGITYTGSPALQWYLPSYSDWKWVFSALGFADETKRMYYFNNWYGYLADIAFTQVGGTTMLGKMYWTSTEHASFAGIMWLDYSDMHWGQYHSKIASNPVRPFVKY